MDPSSFDGRTDSMRLHQRPSVQSVRHKLDGLMDGMDGRITFRFRPSIRPSIRPFRPSHSGKHGRKFMFSDRKTDGRKYQKS